MRISHSFCRNNYLVAKQNKTKKQRCTTNPKSILKSCKFLIDLPENTHIDPTIANHIEIIWELSEKNNMCGHCNKLIGVSVCVCVYLLLFIFFVCVCVCSLSTSLPYPFFLLKKVYRHHKDKFSICHVCGYLLVLKTNKKTCYAQLLCCQLRFCENAHTLNTTQNTKKKTINETQYRLYISK